MKINQATIKAIANTGKVVKAKNPAKPAVTPVTPAKPAKKTKVAKSANKVGVMPAGKPDKMSLALAVLSGVRGYAARFVQVYTFGTRVFIRATQNNNGLSLKDGTFCEVTADKGLVGDKQGLVELGGYVNGKKSGAKVTLTTADTFAKKSGKCLIKWNSDDSKGTLGNYVGVPSARGMSAVLCKFGNVQYGWQMETDTNSHNKHERGDLVSANGKPLPEIKW